MWLGLGVRVVCKKVFESLPGGPQNKHQQNRVVCFLCSFK